MCLIEISPRIETRRLTLRAPSDADAARIAQVCADAAVARMTASMPHPYALGDAFEWIARAQGQDPRRERRFVIDHDDLGTVGMISLFPSDDSPGLPELGYCIGSGWQGRGFATEAVEGLLAWAVRSWGRRAVTAGHFVDNPASGRVLEKAGFLYTGSRTDLFSRARDQSVTTRRMLWLS